MEENITEALLDAIYKERKELSEKHTRMLKEHFFLLTKQLFREDKDISSLTFDLWWDPSCYSLSVFECYFNVVEPLKQKIHQDFIKIYLHDSSDSDRDSCQSLYDFIVENLNELGFRLDIPHYDELINVGLKKETVQTLVNIKAVSRTEIFDDTNCKKNATSGRITYFANGKVLEKVSGE